MRVVGSSTRSLTAKSSPSALVYWKLVMESTRVEYGTCQPSVVSHFTALRVRLVKTLPSLGVSTNSMLSSLV